MSSFPATPDFSLIAALRGQVTQQVPEEVRRLAVEALDWFRDRPAQAGIDMSLAAVKLAAHLHRLEVTASELMEAIVLLDEGSKFRPTVMEFLDAIKRARMIEAAKWCNLGVEVHDDRNPDQPSIALVPVSVRVDGRRNVRRG